MPTVLHLIDSWGPGGAETIFLDVAEGMRARGWRSLTVLPREGWVSDALRSRGFDPILSGSSSGWDVRHLADLLGVIRRHEVDLVQSHLYGSALYGGLAAAVARIPLVATFHGRWDVREATGYGQVKLSIVDRLCDRKVFVSPSLRRALVDEFGMRDDASAVIENGIDTERFRPARNDAFRRELGLTERDFVIGTVGNVRPAKNHGLLVDVAAELAAAGDGIHVVLVGECSGPLFDELWQRRRELDLEDRVHFAGFREDVDRVLGSLDAYVLTSDEEGFSLTTVQAMAAGLPVVATRCGGPEDLIEDRSTGFLVDRGDAKGMAEVLLALRDDEALRAGVGGRARKRAVHRYSLERMVDGYEALYRSVLRLPAAPDATF